MPVKDWLPAAVRAAAADRKLKSGETLFRLGEVQKLDFNRHTGYVQPE